jgi:DNA replication licensing factor MCM4
VLDRVDEGLDRKLAGFLVGLYLEDMPMNKGLDILVSHGFLKYLQLS